MESVDTPKKTRHTAKTRETGLLHIKKLWQTDNPRRRAGHVVGARVAVLFHP